MIAHLLNRAFDLYRETRTPDGSGGFMHTWQLVSSGVPGRVSQPTTAERIVAQQSGADWDARVYLDSSADVRRGDELRDGAEVYRVKATVRPSAPGVYLRADCEHRERRAEP